MEQKTPISIVIPYKQGSTIRLTNLVNLLNVLDVQCCYNVNDQYRLQFEIVLVEQLLTADEKNCSYLLKNRPNMSTLENIEYKYIPLIYNSPFNKSWCVNVGIKNSKYDLFMVVDADTLFGNDFIYRVLEISSKYVVFTKDIFLCWNQLLALPGKDNPIARMIRPDMTAALGGCWCSNKNYFFNCLGGMNENFQGYGGEDNEIYERAIFVQYQRVKQMLNCIPYGIVHQYHDWCSPATDASTLFLITKQNPGKIINKLKAIEVGQISGPTYIKMKV